MKTLFLLSDARFHHPSSPAVQIAFLTPISRVLVPIRRRPPLCLPRHTLLDFFLLFLPGIYRWSRGCSTRLSTCSSSYSLSWFLVVAIIDPFNMASRKQGGPLLSRCIPAPRSHRRNHRALRGPTSCSTYLAILAESSYSSLSYDDPYLAISTFPSHRISSCSPMKASLHPTRSKTSPKFPQPVICDQWLHFTCCKMFLPSPTNHSLERPAFGVLSSAGRVVPFSFFGDFCMYYLDKMQML